MSIEFNILAILIAAATTMPLGALWYEVLFKKPFVALVNPDSFDKKTQKRILAVGMTTTFVGAVLLSSFLWAMGYIVGDFYDTSVSMAALQFGVVAWLSLLAIRVFMHDTFENKPAKLTAIHMSYDLAVIIVIVAVQSLFV